MGITSILDLLDHYPRRYVDRTERAGSPSCPSATGDRRRVRSIRSRRARRQAPDRQRNRADGTGLLELVFFNQPWRERQLRSAPRSRSSARSSSTAGSVSSRIRWSTCCGARLGRASGDGPGATERSCRCNRSRGRRRSHLAAAAPRVQLQRKSARLRRPGRRRHPIDARPGRSRVVLEHHRPEGVRDAWIAAHRLEVRRIPHACRSR
jgi:hypothetical protein